MTHRGKPTVPDTLSSLLKPDFPGFSKTTQLTNLELLITKKDLPRNRFNLPVTIFPFRNFVPPASLVSQAPSACSDMTKHDITTSTHTKPARRRTAAFTLIELLTVIAIIGILAAILLTTLGKVRSLAYQAVCTSNLRQWGIALQMYATENRNKLPYEGSADDVTWSQAQTGSQDTTSWFNALPPYVSMLAINNLPSGFGNSISAGQKKAWFQDKKMIFGCPADKRQALNNAASYITPSYMMNSQLYESHGPTGTKDGPNTENGGRQLTFDDFRDKAPLSRIAFLTEAGTADAGKTRGRVRGHGDDQGYSLDCRHGDGANVVFLDGHVKKFSSKDLNQTTGARIVVWNPWNTY
ncbi:prepilin-type N-terminal cleavage/methylation domain-containing protein [Opitutaceae bacterium TAV1]|nr:prepilin-type N-terminal cleavage/methylation domain-containing protein [Opitutaceae bacterium TAV1]